MREKPILFSAPMVRALLAGTKTQTRRTIKPQPFAGMTDDQVYLKFREQGVLGPDESLTWLVNCAWESGFVDLTCPYGQPGDRLWVRETWRYCAAQISPPVQAIIEYIADGEKRTVIVPDGIEGLPKPPKPSKHKTADARMKQLDKYWAKHRPSIFMPRWASRITLEVTGVRVERLNDISEADALDEGITYNDIPNNGLDPMRARTWYRGLWEQINGPGSWAANPWVWVVEFKRVPQ